jgi:hypothetical protein
MFYFKPQGRKTNIHTALEYLNRVMHRKAIVFVISDFLDEHDFSRPLNVTSKRHDLIALPMIDPVEERLPDVGVITLEDPETGAQIEVNTASKKVREAYQEEARSHASKLLHLFGARRIDMVPLRTNEDYLPTLRSFFASRERRKTR